MHTKKAESSISRRMLGGLLFGGAAVSLGGRLGFAAEPSSSAAADGLPRTPPEKLGIDPQAILAFLDELDAKGVEMHSFMLARHGQVAAEGWWWPYRAELPHMTHSLTKSVTASAVGMAIEEGRFSLSDKVVSFFKDELPAQVSDNLAAMTVEDLLTQRTGHEFNVSGSVWRPIKTSWVAEFFKIPVVFKPGTKFVYTSASTFMLSAIISKTTGLPAYEYLKPRFFAPLGISGEEWEVGPDNITPGANGLSWKVADSLKLGILHEQEGQWQGRQILPAAWVKAVQAQHVPNTYGYQWWLGPHGRYSANGLFGQLSLVYPNEGGVLALMSANIGEKRDALNQAVLNHFPAAFGTDVKADQARSEALSRRLQNLRLLQTPETKGSIPEHVLGKTIRFAPNDDNVDYVRLIGAPGKITFVMGDDRGEHEVVCGVGSWIEGWTTVTGNKLHHEYQPARMRVVAGAGWNGSDTLVLRWQFNETAFGDTLVLRFNGPQVTLDRSVNVNSAPLERPTLKGVLV